jgi:hypothetical protein
MTRRKIVSVLAAIAFAVIGYAAGTQLRVAQAQNYPTFTRNFCSATSGLPCSYTGSCTLSAATTCSFAQQVPATSNCSGDLGSATDTSTGVGIDRATLSGTTETNSITMASSQTTTAGVTGQCL